MPFKMADYHTQWSDGVNTYFFQSGTVYFGNGTPVQGRDVLKAPDKFSCIPGKILQALRDTASPMTEEIDLDSVSVPPEPSQVLVNADKELNHPPAIERFLEHKTRGVVFRQRVS